MTEFDGFPSHGGVVVLFGKIWGFSHVVDKNDPRSALLVEITKSFSFGSRAWRWSGSPPSLLSGKAN